MFRGRSPGNHLFVVLAGVLCLSAGVPAAAQSGGISGRVTAVGGEPLQTLSVMTARTGLPSPLAYPIHATLTDTNGGYSFNNLDAGLYQVRTGVHTLNYINEVTNVEVFAGTTMSNVDFILDVGGIFTGRVQNAFAEPLSNITVRACGADGDSGRSGTTGTDGTYQIIGLASGSYCAMASANGANYLPEWYDNVPYTASSLAPFPTNATAIQVVAETVTGSVDFVLAVGGSIHGLVRDGGGVPVSNAAVTVYETSSGSVVTVVMAVTDTGGVYAACALQTGAYRVKAACSERNLVSEWFDGVPAAGWGVPTNAASVAVTVGDVTTNIDFQLPEGAIVEGFVRSRADGTFLRGVHVSASFENTSMFSADSTTDTNGYYAVRGLSTGRYLLDVSASDQNYLEQEEVLDVVQEATRSNVNFKLDEGGVITGRVTTAGGLPLSGIYISYYVSSPGLFIIWSSGSVATDTNGNYHLDRLRTATCEVSAFSAQRSYVTQTKSVPATAGESTGADFELVAAGAIHGEVTGPGGTPLKGISVLVLGTNGSWHGSQRTASNGQYAIGGLESNDYCVQALAENTNFIAEWFDEVVDFISYPPSNAARIVVGVGEVVSNVDFELAEGGVIAGTVTNDDGSPLGGVSVSACWTNRVQAQSAETAADGSYSILGLPNGVYGVQAWENSALNVLGEWYDNVPDLGGFPTNAAMVAVTAGTVTNHVDFSLASGGVIAGRIADTSSKGIAWATLSIKALSNQMSHIYFAGTDADGRFAIGAWTSGWYTVSTVADDSWYLNASATVYVSAASTTDVNFVLERLPAEVSEIAVSQFGSVVLSWGVDFGVECQVEQSTNLLTWSDAPDADAVDERSRRLGGTLSILQYHGSTGTADRLFLRVKRIEP